MNCRVLAIEKTRNDSQGKYPTERNGANKQVQATLDSAPDLRRCVLIKGDKNGMV